MLDVNEASRLSQDGHAVFCEQVEGGVRICASGVKVPQPIPSVKVIEEPHSLADSAHLDEDGLGDVSDHLTADAARKAREAHPPKANGRDGDHRTA